MKRKRRGTEEAILALEGDDSVSIAKQRIPSTDTTSVDPGDSPPRGHQIETMCDERPLFGRLNTSRWAACSKTINSGGAELKVRYTRDLHSERPGRQNQGDPRVRIKAQV